MLLTRRGAGVVIGALLLVAAGRILGVLELFVLAAGVGGLIVIAALTVFGRRARLHARRHVSPARVHVGDESRVDLFVHNDSRSRSPVVTVRDSFDNGARQARFLVAPMAANESDQASYRLPADRRGRFVLGPLEAHRADAFGLCSWKTTIGPPVEMTVYPAIETVTPMAPARGHRTAASHPATTGPSGEDFANLRAYEVGDDLRQVHWPSTAKLDELMIRQLDHPLEGHATVLLDLRARAHTDASLERAVSAAASVIVACSRAGSLVRLATTEGLDSGFGTGQAHVDAIMDRLAVAQLGDGDHLAGVVGAVSRSRYGGPTAVISSDALAGDDLAMVAHLQARRRRVAVVLFDRLPTQDPRRGSAGPEMAGPEMAGIERAGSATTILRVGRSEQFAAVWNRAMAGGATGRVALARGWG